MPRPPLRLPWLGQAFREGLTLEQIQDATKMDRWFLDQIAEIV